MFWSSRELNILWLTSNLSSYSPESEMISTVSRLDIGLYLSFVVADSHLPTSLAIARARPAIIYVDNDRVNLL